MALASPSASSRSIIAVHDVNTVAASYDYLFTVPQDAQSIMGKIWLDSTWNAAGSAVVYIQTTEDGGTTWRDCSATAIGAATVAATMNNANAHFIPLALAWGSAKGADDYVGSVASTSLVAAVANASATGIVSGLPIMSTLGRVRIALTSTITTGGINVQVFAPTTDFTA